MVKIKFNPQNIEVEVEAATKILAAAIKNKVPIRYGCGSCKCGTCAVSLSYAGKINEIAEDERRLLNSMGLPLEGQVRLSCRAKVLEGSCEVDLNFQNTYDPGNKKI